MIVSVKFVLYRLGYGSRESRWGWMVPSPRSGSIGRDWRWSTWRQWLPSLLSCVDQIINILKTIPSSIAWFSDDCFSDLTHLGYWRYYLVGEWSGMPRDLPVRASCSEPTVNGNFLCSDTTWLSRTAAFLLSSCYRRSFRLLILSSGPEGKGLTWVCTTGKDDGWKSLTASNCNTQVSI